MESSLFVCAINEKGFGLLIINEAQFVFQALSLTTNEYIPFHVILLQLIYIKPLSVALTQEKLSLKSIMIHVVYIVPDITHVNSGLFLSIQFTVAVTDHVFPARSWKVKVNDPLPVNVCPVAFLPVRISLALVRLTTTFPLVKFHETGTYCTSAVGAILSIQKDNVIVSPVNAHPLAIVHTEN